MNGIAPKSPETGSQVLPKKKPKPKRAMESLEREVSSKKNNSITAMTDSEQISTEWRNTTSRYLLSLLVCSSMRGAVRAVTGADAGAGRFERGGLVGRQGAELGFWT